MSTQADLFGADVIGDLLDQTTSATHAGQTDADDAAAANADGRGAGVHTQWFLDELQVVNWGGFAGHHTLRFHRRATLLSGGSGTGKSTLLDAYTALMMPHTVAFNGASNDSGTGRARNESGGQRTLLTYLRGKQGVNDETGGASSESLLRGNGEPTWGAIAATFASAAGARFSALRVFFVPASATEVAAISNRMATLHGPVDLSDLDEPMRHHTAGKPLANLITNTWPGAKVGKYTEFSNTLFTKLAIGANGDGAKALDLLARIQAGRPVNSVNILYRDLVLDTPSTFDDADRALRHFDVLDEDLNRMIDAERKHATLRDIRDVQARLVTARDRAAALDQYGLAQPGFTKLTAWSLRKEGDLLDDAASLARTRHASSEIATRAANVEVDRLWADLETTRADYRDAGGDELTGLADQIKALSAKVGPTTRNRDDLLNLVRTVRDPDGAGAAGPASPANPASTASPEDAGEPVGLGSRGEFDALQGDARAFVAARETWASTFQDRRDELRDQLKDLDEQRSALKQDLAQLRKSGTRIKGGLAIARDQVAERLGMRAADLPFLAELIDLRPGQERWRTAVETVLGPDASRIVVPAQMRREIARALNDMPTGRQVRFIDGTADMPTTYPLTGATTDDQADRILGKLAFADHRYAGWVQAHLAASGSNAVCVERPDDLDGGGSGSGMRVTLTGQTRNGIRSAIGRNNSADIIGFSSEADIAKAEADLDRVQADLARLMTAMSDLVLEDRNHKARSDAYIAILQARFDDVDVQGLTDRIAQLEARKAELEGTDDVLAGLSAQIETLEGQHRQALRVHAEKANETATLHATWVKLSDAKDKVTDRLAPYEDENGGYGAFDLTEAQDADLAAVYAATLAHAGEEDAIAEASRFGERLATMSTNLRAQAQTAQTAVTDAEQSLTKTFRQFHGIWPDNNLGVTHTAYPDYLRILGELENKGLYETREEWQRTVARWSGEDLLPLSQALGSEVDAIKARVMPINDILATIPFGARRGRLRLKVAEIRSESVRQFRVRLRKMTTIATRQMTFEETRKAFDELSAFMDLLREPKDPRYNPERSDRTKLIDVRRHVEVYAVEYPVDGATWPAREHRQLGSASGGESQELIAFIIGSALRFRLGDELRDWPRFTPVFLDEGFVKADSEFAGRAVSAWRRLGFQIIVGTPEDKFTGLERHMDSFVVVSKDQDTGLSFLDTVTDHQPTHQSEHQSDPQRDQDVHGGPGGQPADAGSPVS